MERVIRDARSIFDEAVRSVQADRLIASVDWWAISRLPIEQYRRVIVVAIGKAAMAMSGEVEAQLGDRIDAGLAIVPFRYPETLPEYLTSPGRIVVVEAAHPIPDGSSISAARALFRLVSRCEESDLVLVLLSGGGTSLFMEPVPGIALSDVSRTYELLLRAGADIHDMNVVRKHLTRTGGGGLARAAFPADVVTLVVSDVVGDELSVIASGPTHPDPSTFADAWSVLERFALPDRVPAPVIEHLKRGMEDPSIETAKPGDPVFRNVRTELIGSNRIAVQAAAAEAQRLGYEVMVESDPVVGEASRVGRQLAERFCSTAGRSARCLVSGGETTVVVRGPGKGGRNQELALAAAIESEGYQGNVAFLSGGTDGLDGPTPAAGALTTPAMIREARRRGLDPVRFLEANDTYTFFEATGSLLVTGPTHTNVMDVQLALELPE